MGDHELLQNALQRAIQACATTAQALQAAQVAPEALAEFVPERRLLLVLPKAATMRPLGEVWRLGSLLLHTSGELWAAGRATRAAERGRPGYQSLSRENRRDLAAAALRGRYAAGTAVNFDARPLPLNATAIAALDPDAPIGFADGEIRVRWRAGAPLSGAAPLAQYLRERSGLLITPPFAPS